MFQGGDGPGGGGVGPPCIENIAAHTDKLSTFGRYDGVVVVEDIFFLNCVVLYTGTELGFG